MLKRLFLLIFIGLGLQVVPVRANPDFTPVVEFANSIMDYANRDMLTRAIFVAGGTGIITGISALLEDPGDKWNTAKKAAKYSFLGSITMLGVHGLLSYAAPQARGIVPPIFSLVMFAPFIEGGTTNVAITGAVLCAGALGATGFASWIEDKKKRPRRPSTPGT